MTKTANETMGLSNVFGLTFNMIINSNRTNLSDINSFDEAKIFRILGFYIVGQRDDKLLTLLTKCIY